MENWPWLLRWIYFKLLSKLPDPVVRSGPPDVHVAALTFDDGPSEPYTQEILKELDSHGVRGTFFLLGKNVRTYSSLAREIVAKGHSIGAHTYGHPVPIGRNPFHLWREIVQTHRLISRVTGKTPEIFRPPQGNLDPMLFACLRIVMGYSVILWSVSARDWRGDRAEDIVARVLAGVKPGGIVCFHDGSEDLEDQAFSDRSQTVIALPAIIDHLHSEGYQLITIPELLKLRQRRMLDD